MFEQSTPSAPSRILPATVGTPNRETNYSSGFWIDKRIAALLDKEENEELRRGYRCEAFNSRGVRVVDFSGKREHAAAQEQHRIADDLENNHFPNFAKVFRDLAKIYEQEAESAIKDGERFKKQDTDDL